jgi:hypothetical protein
MQKITFTVVLIMLVGFSSLVIESAPAHDSNRSTTMQENRNGNMNNGVRRRRRKHRKYRRHKMKYKMNKASKGNANH